MISSRNLSQNLSQTPWYFILLLTLGLLLGGSLTLDLLVMPMLYADGMMADAGFAAAGSMMFWMVNHAELIGAAVVLTGVLALAVSRPFVREGWAIALATVLFSIPLLYTYWLMPEMIATGAQLDLFSDRFSTASQMNWLHGGYWGLEILKITAGLWLFRLIDQVHLQLPETKS